MAVLTPRRQPHVSVAVDILISRFPKKALGAAVGAVVSGLVLTAGQAKALVVNVGGLEYDVTTFTGSYNENVSKFETPGNGGLMPWWGSASDAWEFASAACQVTFNACESRDWELGYSNILHPDSQPFGPFFANRVIRAPWLAEWPNPSQVAAEVRVWPGISNFVHLGPNDTWTYAQASLVSPGGGGGGGSLVGSADVPGPLPILGVAAAFGFSRKLRKRIKLHKVTSAVSTSPGA